MNWLSQAWKTLSNLTSTLQPGFGTVDSQPQPNEQLHLYQQLTRTLLSGTAHTSPYQSQGLRRPPLPLELVLAILRYAECILPNPTSDLTCVPSRARSARALTGDTVTVPWFRTAVFDQYDLHNIAQAQLWTFSHDQGFCQNPSQGSWSWFELAIVMPLPPQSTSPPEPQNAPGFQESTSDSNLHRDPELVGNFVLKTRPDGVPLSWRSHHNIIASRVSSWRDGIVFGPSHEIWTWLAAGDALEVRLCAKFGAWENYGEFAELRFWEWYEPGKLRSVEEEEEEAVWCADDDEDLCE